MAFSLESFSLAGKVAVVTGAGGRGASIGRAYAQGLAAVGASVVVADLNGEGAQAVAAELTASGAKAIGVQVDITDEAAVAKMAKAARDTFGGVDILVNNAALMVELQHEPMVDMRIADWNRLLDVNLNGALICTQACVPMMRERGGGKIVNQVSGGAYPPSGAYGISKLALVGLTVALAKQLGKDNINVNAIAPGATQSEAGKSLTQPDSAFGRMIEASAALRPRGQPDDLVGALLLLCSPAGSWITGQTLRVDGGWIMQV
jgi:NAD(P)-dependent dehydrogenase (short-subunit alcohol dehydrogenase family)